MDNGVFIVFSSKIWLNNTLSNKHYLKNFYDYTIICLSGELEMRL